MKDIIATIRGILFYVICKLTGSKVTVKEGLKVYKKLKVKGNGRVIIGTNCSFGGIPGADDQYVTLYTYSDDAVIEIGDNVKLFAAKMSCKYSISIGSDVLIEEASLLDTDFHSVERSRANPQNEYRESCEIIIGDRVSIAAKSVISKGARIGEDSIVGPCSVVNRVFPPGSLIFGNPAKQIKTKKIAQSS